jgi:hypothetical protein
MRQGKVDGRTESGLDSAAPQFKINLYDSIGRALILSGTSELLKQDHKWSWVDLGQVLNVRSEPIGRFLLIQRQIEDEPDPKEIFLEYVTPFGGRFTGWMHSDTIATLRSVKDSSINLIFRRESDNWKTVTANVVLGAQEFSYTGKYLSSTSTPLYKQEVVTGELRVSNSGDPRGVLRITTQFWR